MKNLRVSMKLIVSFLLAALLTGIVGFVGILGMMQINSGASDMYDLQTVPLPYMGKAIEMLQRQRACMREYLVGAAIGDFDLIEDAHDRALAYHRELGDELALYRATIRTDVALAAFDDALRLYNSAFQECMETIYQGAKRGDDAAELYVLMGTYTADTNRVVDMFDDVLQMKIDLAADSNAQGDSTFTSMLILILVVLVAAIVISMFLAFYISRLISKPLALLTAFMQKAGTTGDITLAPQDVDTIGKYGEIKDEVGQTIFAAAAFVKRMNTIGEILGNVAAGDLTHDIDPLSDRDVMGNALHKMVTNLNDMFGEINNSTTQVSDGSKQIADGAQALAQGSTQQAAAVQELSSSISEIAQKTKENAEMAGKAANLAGAIKQNAEKGSRQMDEMMGAVKEINQASQNINKVISVIDNIAFQTNILALNAAVEAARAGQHGKGFAVVAEEVRSLASKSAEAAKETGALIANSMEKAELGARIADETAASLTEIVSGINESTQLVSEIAKSSEEQSLGISQVNRGIDQVAQVVQQNSATAEESAAASEEMSGQSHMLEELIAQFKLRGGVTAKKSLGAAKPKKQLVMPEKTSYAPPAGDSDFGKY
ncbi:MAG: methyl-accepting chemotaxis protein [Oscillospiraceae bacterium]|nr:methyl-accepting chemotaxis protein [Oscillospiraceae bacterium]